MRSDAPIRYSLVVPFYNEQENIPQLYMKLTEVMDALGEPCGATAEEFRADTGAEGWF